MIVAPLSDPILRAAARLAARPDEDVVCEPGLVWDAMRRGVPRGVIRFVESRPSTAVASARDEAPTIFLTKALLGVWEVERRAQEIPRSRVADLALRLRFMLKEEAGAPTWVDGMLRDLARAVGVPLPLALKGLARRVLEYPAHYVDLGSLARVSGLSRGALKARFRRRGLASPFFYLRWLRVLAATQVLRDPSVTTFQVADRLGFTTGGNFCRAVTQTTGLTPSELRTGAGRGYVLAAFATSFMDPDGLHAWMTLDDVFLARVA